MKAESILLNYIRDCILRIGDYLHGEYTLLESSPMVQAAVLRELQTMAETTMRLADESRERHNDVPWAEIRDFRNILVHGYLGVDMEVVRGIVVDDLPGLLRAVESLLRDREESA